VRGGNTSGSLRGGRPPEKSNFYCHPGRAGGSPRLLDIGFPFRRYLAPLASSWYAPHSKRLVVKKVAECRMVWTYVHCMYTSMCLADERLASRPLVRRDRQDSPDIRWRLTCPAMHAPVIAPALRRAPGVRRKADWSPGCLTGQSLSALSGRGGTLRLHIQNSRCPPLPLPADGAARTTALVSSMLRPVMRGHKRGYVGVTQKT
jgi:hypothetical protein